jgi:hypothetical protein
MEENRPMPYRAIELQASTPSRLRELISQWIDLYLADGHTMLRLPMKLGRIAGGIALK